MPIDQFPDSNQALQAPAAEIEPAAPYGQVDAKIFTPEENAEMQKKIAEVKADKDLLAKIEAGGELDATNPAEVAAAMRVIKQMTGKDVRLTVEEAARLRESEGGVAAAEVVGSDPNVVSEVENERLRDRTAEMQRINETNGNAIVTSFKGEEIIESSRVQDEFEQDPGRALTRERKVLVTLDEQYDKKPELYEVVNREGDTVTLSRVDRIGPDGKELSDPKDWKVLLKKVTVSDLMGKKPRIAG